MRPESLEGDWNRLYREFPEVYDAFARVEHRPRPVDIIAEHVRLDGATVVDVGSGSGTSTFELAERAARVIGVEPSAPMRALAEREAARLGIEGVSFLPGSASELPVADESADVVAAVTAALWPAEEVVPRFVAEALRVLRPGGTAIVLDTHPEWYGGELRHLVRGAPDYERALDREYERAGFTAHDFETVQDYGTTEHAVRTYGFIFGSEAIAHLRAHAQTRISWVWRLRLLRKTRR